LPPHAHTRTDIWTCKLISFEAHLMGGSRERPHIVKLNFGLRKKERVEWEVST
jgi:hypothetical protein